MLDINNFSFTYKQLSPPDARRAVNEWECLILNKESNVSFGLKFSCQGDPTLLNQELFNAFCDKNAFKQQFFIDCEEIKEEVKEIEKPIDESPKIDQNT